MSYIYICISRRGGSLKRCIAVKLPRRKKPPPRRSSYGRLKEIICDAVYPRASNAWNQYVEEKLRHLSRFCLHSRSILKNHCVTLDRMMSDFFSKARNWKSASPEMPIVEQNCATIEELRPYIRKLESTASSSLRGDYENRMLKIVLINQNIGTSSESGRRKANKKLVDNR